MNEEAVAVEAEVEPAVVTETPEVSTGSQSWSDMIGSLPDGMGEHNNIKRYGSFEDFARGSINSSSMVSKKASEFWASEDPSDIAERNSIMGVPADAAGYGLVKPEGFPEDIPYDETYLANFAEFAAENGVSKDLAVKMQAWQADQAKEMFETSKNASSDYREEKIAELRKEWGNDFDYNDSKVSQIADHLGITQTLMDTGLAYEPLVQKMLLEQIGPAISNDKLIESAKQDNFATIQDALTSVEGELFSMDSTDARYSSKVAERTALLNKLP